MNTIKTTINNDLSHDGINAELRAIKLAIALMATRLPPELRSERVTDALKSTGDKHATELTNLIQQFIDEANSQN